MRRGRGPAGGVLVAILPLILLAAGGGGAQESGVRPGPGEPTFSLGPPFPNPFERETRIPFVLGEALFEGGERPTVSMRIYNLLHQLVGFAYLEETEAEPRRPLDGVALPGPGRYEAGWDGRDADGEPVMEGPYFLQLSVDGRSQVRKVLFVDDDGG